MATYILFSVDIRVGQEEYDNTRKENKEERKGRSLTVATKIPTSVNWNERIPGLISKEICPCPQ